MPLNHEVFANFVRSGGEVDHYNYDEEPPDKRRLMILSCPAPASAECKAHFIRLVSELMPSEFDSAEVHIYIDRIP